MLYGLILESIRNGIILNYGLNIWKRIVHEIDLSSETFDVFMHYSDKLMLNICDCLADILHEGTRDTYLQIFGQDLFRQFQNFGYQKYFRIAGRTLREFFFSIDQLHDSNRYIFPEMRSPLFHVTEENHLGTMLEYKSVRHGLIYYAKGCLLGVAKTLFNEKNIQVYIRNDLSTKEYTHVIFWVEFNNRKYSRRNLFNFPQLPNVAGSTLSSIFPFSILMDCSLRIHHMGKNLEKLFSNDTILIQRPLDEVFRLIRPDIHVEWDKLLSYGRHIVFLMENRLPLRIGPLGRIRLKGQMKYLENKNMLWFLCHPVLGSADDMISAGLHLTDLNLFDSASELLINSMHQTKEIENIIDKKKLCSIQIKQTKSKLLQYEKYRQDLLCTIVPKHIALMIQSEISTYNFCETHPLITVMFGYVPDFELVINQLEPTEAVELFNKAIQILNEIVNKYDACSIKPKMNGSCCMIATGLHNRANVVFDELPSSRKSTISNDDIRTTSKNLLEFNTTEVMAYLSLELLHNIKNLINPITHKSFNIKIGFHTGSAIGGMIGEGNSQYCLFGDAVTTAKQMIDTSEINEIHISHAAYHHLVANDHFIMEYRHYINNENTNITYWLRDIKKLSSTPVVDKTTALQ